MKFILFFLLSSICLADITQSDIEEIHGNGIYYTSQYDAADKHIQEINRDFTNLVDLAERTNLALRGIITVATKNLNRRGYYLASRDVELKWEQLDGKLIQFARNQRGIGDFPAFSQKLDEIYQKIEDKLGLKLCLALRISDIRSINSGLTVVMNPCKYGYDEFFMHFATNDPKYRSLFPVVCYWTTVITCSIGTYGLGYFFVCSPIGMLVELAADKKIGPFLAPRIYKMACE